MKSPGPNIGSSELFLFRPFQLNILASSHLKPQVFIDLLHLPWDYIRIHFPNVSEFFLYIATCHPRIYPCNHKEGSTLRCYWNPIIRRELCQWLPLNSIFLLVAGKNPEILFNAWICSFSLSVSLQAEYSWQLPVNLQAFAQVFPEYCRKFRSAVRYYCPGESMQPYYFHYEHLR